MRFTIYVAKEFEPEFTKFTKTQTNPSRRICNIVSKDLNNLNINVLRSILKSDINERKRIKELLNEFEAV